jgi:hypothetical protein
LDYLIEGAALSLAILAAYFSARLALDLALASAANS